MLFMGLLEVFIRSQCDLEDPCGRPESRIVPDPIYDYIVVGGGSAGMKQLVLFYVFTPCPAEVSCDRSADADVPNGLYILLCKRDSKVLSVSLFLARISSQGRLWQVD